MPEDSLRDTLLPLLQGHSVPDAEQALAAADPTGAEEVLLHLVRLGQARGGPEAPDVEGLLAWARGEAVQPGPDRSVLLAEMLEGALDEADVGAGLSLAAAGVVGTAREPWPAHYRRGAWHVVLDLDEDERLVGFVEATAAGQRAEALDLAGLVVPVQGDLAPIGPAEDVLGAPPEFNPWSELALVTDAGRVGPLKREST